MERRVAKTRPFVGERLDIIWLWLEGLSTKDISLKTGVSVSTVYRWIRRWQKSRQPDAWWNRPSYTSILDDNPVVHKNIVYPFFLNHPLSKSASNVTKHKSISNWDNENVTLGILQSRIYNQIDLEIIPISGMYRNMLAAQAEQGSTPKMDMRLAKIKKIYITPCSSLCITFLTIFVSYLHRE